MSRPPLENSGEDPGENINEDVDEDKDERIYVKPLYCKTIKLPAKNFLKKNASSKIEELVRNSSSVITQAHLLVKAFTLFEFHSRNEIDYPNAKLASYAMSLIGNIAQSTTIPIRQRLRNYFNEYFERLLDPNRPVLNGYCNIFVNASEQMETNYMNNIMKMYPKYLKKLITAILDGPEPEDKSKLTQSEIQDRKKLKQTNKPIVVRIYKAVIVNNSASLEPAEKNVFDRCLKEFVPTHEWKKPPKTETEEEGVPNIPYDVKTKNYSKYLLYMLKINSLFEQYRIPLYQPLSLSNSEIPRHINLQATSFVNLFDRQFIGYQGHNNRYIYNSLKKSHPEGVQNMKNLWNHFINMKHPAFKRYLRKKFVFYNVIYTDNVSCSVIFAKFPDEKEAALNAMAKKIYVKKLLNPHEPKYVTDLLTEEKEMIKDWVTISVDPGKKDLAHFMDDSKGNEAIVRERRNRKNKFTNNDSIFSKKMYQKDVLFKYSNNRRREEALFSKSEQTRLRIRRKPIDEEGNTVIDLEQELSDFNSRTTDYDRFMQFVIKKLEVGNRVRHIYHLKCFRSMKLRGFINARKSIDNMMNQVYNIYKDGEEPIVLAYGDWGASNQLRGCAPSMGKGLRSKFVKRPLQFKVVLVDEFRTSKMCNECGKETINKTFKNKKNKKTGRKEKIHRVLICKECCDREGSDKAICRYTNRDVNGSKNILKVYRSVFRTSERPEYLKRGLTALEKKAEGPGEIGQTGKSEPVTQAPCKRKRKERCKKN